MGNVQPQKSERVRDWAGRVFVARTEAEVMAVVNRFLTTFLPSELEHLPQGCRFSALRRVPDLADAAVDLARCELALPIGSPGALIALEMMQVLIPAHVRIRQILAHSADPRTTR